MKGLMKRWVICCSFCNKSTDCLAYEEEGAQKNFIEGGWRVIHINRKLEKGIDKELQKRIVCRHCMRKYGLKESVSV
ncbi:MAG: hypothetical protein C0401_06550 [Anaerolinea sp.]|nr:hypothetical protein [Anaerolinea sp.]